jgi:hypothetical protein
MDYLISHLTSSCHSASKITLTLPQLDYYQIILILRRIQHTQLNARKKQSQDTNCTWLVIRSLTSEEQRIGTGCWRWRFIAVQRKFCFNGPLCVAELVCYTMKPELYWYQGECLYVSCFIFNSTSLRQVRYKLLNVVTISNWWNVKDFSLPYI